MIRPDTLDIPGVAAFSGGCLRFDSRDGIYIHHNDAHTTAGIRDTPTIDDRGRILIRHSAPGPIVTMFATADESLVARGIAFGLSGGAGKTIVVAAKNGRALDLRRSADYAELAGPYCNAWIFWLHDRSAAASK